MSLLRLRQFLDSYNIKYVIISHSVAYTAETIAALTHIPGKEVAKTVIVKINDTLAMAVVCASQHVDLELLKAATKAQAVQLPRSTPSGAGSPIAKPVPCPPLATSTE